MCKSVRKCLKQKIPTNLLIIMVTGGKGDAQMAGKRGLDLHWLQFLPTAPTVIKMTDFIFKGGSGGQNSDAVHSCGGAQQPCFLLEEVR